LRVSPSWNASASRWRVPSPTAWKRSSSKGEVRLVPHGANGQLRWRDLETFGALVPLGKTGDDPVGFVFPMARRQP
jgi:hypothetical protein